jgi:hypothetical protein
MTWQTPYKRKSLSPCTARQENDRGNQIATFEDSFSTGNVKDGKIAHKTNIKCNHKEKSTLMMQLK